MGRGWVTPVLEPTGDTQLVLTVPNRPEYRAILRAVLFDMTIPGNWQQVPGVTIDTQLAADWSTIILDSFEEDE